MLAGKGPLLEERLGYTLEEGERGSLCAFVRVPTLLRVNFSLSKGELSSCLTNHSNPVIAVQTFLATHPKTRFRESPRTLCENPEIWVLCNHVIT